MPCCEKAGCGKEWFTMHINLESDYAVRIVHCLAMEYSSDNSQGEHRIDAQTISDRTAVSLRFTLKIMRKLVAAGIVKSYKGAHGGYRLTRLPQEITLRQVIEAVEGPYRFSRCVDDDYICNCNPMENCAFRSVFDEVTTLVINKLDQVNFDTLSLKK
jgi:Rrf2 family protein